MDDPTEGTTATTKVGTPKAPSADAPRAAPQGRRRQTQTVTTTTTTGTEETDAIECASKKLTK